METYIAIFIIGTIIGSFLNVCIYRLPKGLSITKPRSFCTSCGTQIAWYDNIPILSYIFLAGKCRHCKSFISIRYLIVEILTGALFCIIYYQIFIKGINNGYGEPIGETASADRWFIYLVYLFIVSALIAASLIDIELQIIPDEINKSGIALAPIISLLCPNLHTGFGVLSGFRIVDTLLASIIGMLVGSGLIFMLGKFGTWIFKKDAMGFGDVKLMAAIGGFLGWKSAVRIFFVAPILGAIIGVFVWLKGKDRRIPYGPFLALATLVIMFHWDKVWPLGRWLGAG